MAGKIKITRRPDLKALSAIHTASFPKGWSAAYLAESMRVEGTLAIVAAKEEGFALLRCGLEEANIVTLAVRPAYRRRGVASALLDALLSEARRQKAEAVFLKVNEHNAEAIRFYTKRGFFLISRLEDFYGNPDGSRSHALVMRYLIE